MAAKVVMAVAAHPDDIEFMMAGTLLMLSKRGYETHYLAVANGSCGSRVHPAEELIAIRAREAREAASILGARFHESFCNDMEVFYDIGALRRLAGILRKVRPAVVLAPSPQDYMEDHTNTCRLAVSAAFTLGLPNFRTEPEVPLTEQPVTVYHAMPHALRDSLRSRVMPGGFVNTSEVQAIKRKALSAHRSQHEYLALTQAMPNCVEAMETMSREMGRLSGRFKHAEGWRKHSPVGFCPPETDPLKQDLGSDYMVYPPYEKSLEEWN